MKKYFNLVFIFMLICCLFVGCASNQKTEEQTSEKIIVEPVVVAVEDDLVTDTTEEFYNQFLELYNNGNIENYDAIERLLEKWEKAYPANPDLYTAKFNYTVALAFISETREETFSHIDEAIRNLLDALILYPDRLDIWFGLINFSQNIGDYNLTLDTMRGCIERSKINNHEWFWTLDKLVFAEEAPLEYRIEDFLWNFHDYLTFWLNKYTYETHDCVKYIGPFLLEMDPNNVVILNDMALCHLNLGENEEAKVYLLKAHEINPKDYIVAGNLAILALNENDFTNAWNYAAILQNCDNPEYVELGNNIMKDIAELLVGEDADSFQYIDDIF